MKLSRDYRPELLCSTDEDRPAILHPYLKGAFLFATDGRRIGQFPVELEDGDVDGAVLRNVLIDARDSADSADGMLHISCAKDTLSYKSQFGWVKWERPQLDKIINYRSAIAEFPQRKAKQIGMNIDFLTSLSEAFGSPSFMLSFDETTAMLVFEPLPQHGTLMPAKSTFGVFMPINVRTES